jgi:TolB-like protein/Tfp pilus assembly protein PilF
MASIIPAFEYDIFISYRQKDNKYDGWVTEFVSNLKKELEATFKEEISVYFDINPHDGLLETHDVDASLKEKLKCLVFIPIISRTYCDPKSFAWEHEFRAFVDLASNDRFGLKVKLPGGNVASRVLPVRIHDLDPGDIKLCESVLGGVMRGVEFIYKEPGVNRSLTTADDEKKNLNKTAYRNQINKVALAVREILLGLQTVTVGSEKDDTQQRISYEEVFKEDKQTASVKTASQKMFKLLSGFLITAMVIIAAILVFSKFFKRDKPEPLSSSNERISIAVMPFQNMTNDTIWNVWQYGIQNEMINNLTNIEELKVRQVQSFNNALVRKGIKNYSSLTPSLASEISKNLDAEIYLFGSIKKAGDVIRVNAQLIDTKTEEVFKSFNIEEPAREIMIFDIIDSLSLQVKDFLILHELQKPFASMPGSKYSISTSSPEAFRYYLYAGKAYWEADYSTAINWLSQAIAIDSNYIDAICSLSYAYLNSGQAKEAKKWCLWLYKKKDTLPVNNKLSISYMHSLIFETPNESIKYLMQQQDLDDQQNMHYLIGLAYMALDQYDKAVSELEKYIELSKKLWPGQPEDFRDYIQLGNAYHSAGEYKKEKRLYRKAEKLFPDNAMLKGNQIILALTTGDTIAANRYVEKYVSIRKEKLHPEAAIVLGLGILYNNAVAPEKQVDAYIQDKAEKYLRKALSMQPDNPGMLAWFLIDKDRNVSEGMELNEKEISLNSEDVNNLATRGWGLYKQGKLKESLEVLEKAWDLRDRFNPDLYRCIQTVKKTIAEQK